MWSLIRILHQLDLSPYLGEELARIIWRVPLILLEKRMTKYIFGRFLARFVETIHVKLPDEAVDISVTEIFG